jgi:hypothetical protein
LAANLAYLYTLPLYTFFSSLYHNVVIQSTLLQYCDSIDYIYIEENTKVEETTVIDIITISYKPKYLLSKYIVEKRQQVYIKY